MAGYVSSPFSTAGACVGGHVLQTARAGRGDFLWFILFVKLGLFWPVSCGRLLVVGAGLVFSTVELERVSECSGMI